MVHVSEVTLLIACFVVPFVMIRLDFASSFNASNARLAHVVAAIPSGANSRTPTLKNSRSTRRERRNQLSTRLIV